MIRTKGLVVVVMLLLAFALLSCGESSNDRPVHDTAPVDPTPLNSGSAEQSEPDEPEPLPEPEPDKYCIISCWQNPPPTLWFYSDRQRDRHLEWCDEFGYPGCSNRADNIISKIELGILPQCDLRGQSGCSSRNALCQGNCALLSKPEESSLCREECKLKTEQCEKEYEEENSASADWERCKPDY